MNSVKLQVKTNSKNYPIIIGKNIIGKLPKFLSEKNLNFLQCLIIVDNNVPKKIVKNLSSSLLNKKITIHYFKANEKNKSQKSVNKILSILLKNNFNRNDCLISIGGGITGDTSGFAASIFKRGLTFVNIPTTLLSQVDSSIGGKTGINSSYGKNLIGSFYQPDLVISDVKFLKSLPLRELICGYGEILKHSLIADKKFFLFLDKNRSKILSLDNSYIIKAIYKSCLIKKRIVESDEKESSLRKILNFGHTFAHAYEATLNYSKKLNHGEAVILGIKIASKFSLSNKLLSIKEFKLIETHISKLNFNKDKLFSKKNTNTILSFMKKDKKNISKKINLILLKKIGSASYNFQFTKEKIRTFLMKELAK
jgi:3-dehydroquinate synthase/shikimate kinase/3-dehydroquinate synthase